MSKKEIGAKITLVLPPSEEEVHEELMKIYMEMPFWKRLAFIFFAWLARFSAEILVKILVSEIDKKEAEKKW